MIVLLSVNKAKHLDITDIYWSFSDYNLVNGRELAFFLLIHHIICFYLAF